MTETRTQRLLIVGASGHARVIADIAREIGSFTIVGVCTLDGTGSFGDVPVLGPRTEVPALWRAGTFDVASIAIGFNYDRARAVEQISSEAPDLPYATLIHPRAVVSKSAHVGVGTVVMAGAVINPAATIGQHAIINTNCSIDHDCTIGDFTSVSPGAALGGNVKLGYCTYVGIGAAISHRVAVGEHVVIGAGAVVVRDLGEKLVAMGVPARAVRARAPEEPYL